MRYPRGNRRPTPEPRRNRRLARAARIGARSRVVRGPKTRPARARCLGSTTMKHELVVDHARQGDPLAVAEPGDSMRGRVLTSFPIDAKARAACRHSRVHLGSASTRSADACERALTRGDLRKSACAHRSHLFAERPASRADGVSLFGELRCRLRSRFDLLRELRVGLQPLIDSLDRRPDDLTRLRLETGRTPALRRLEILGEAERDDREKLRRGREFAPPSARVPGRARSRCLRAVGGTARRRPRTFGNGRRQSRSERYASRLGGR